MVENVIQVDERVFEHGREVRICPRCMGTTAFECTACGGHGTLEVDVVTELTVSRETERV